MNLFKKFQRTSLSKKIFLPIAMGFVLLLATFGALIYSLRIQREEMLRSVSATRQVINLAERLYSLEHHIHQTLLSFRFDQDARHIEEIRRDSASKSRLLGQAPVAELPEEGKKLFQGYLEARQGLENWQEEVIAAIQSGDQQQVARTYDKWLLKFQQVSASLADITVYSTSLLEKDISTIRHITDGVSISYLMVLIVTGVLVLVLYSYLRNTVIVPLKKLTLGTKFLSQQKLDWKFEADSQDEIGKLGQAFNDMAEKLKDSYTRLEAMAYSDSLTGLPNRQVLERHLGELLEKAGLDNALFSIMLLDLDRFKKINDTLGHDAGDRVLKEAAGRIKANMREGDEVFRLGGDEFVVLLGSLKQAHDAAAVAERILDSLNQPIKINGRNIYVSGSIGLAVYPYDGQAAAMLLKNADVALYGAKSGGRNRYNLYNKIADLRPGAQLELESDLHEAIKEKQFKVYYQPIVRISDGRLVGAEALVRWQHPKFGLLMPHEFIPIAEEAGLISEVGEWVLKAACKEAAPWAESGPDFRLAINLSSRQFLSAGLVDNICSLLRETGFPPHRLVLEITESVAISQVEMTRQKLKLLSDQGIAISIDDFGIGYSSLSYLKDFSINKIKIDRSFIRHVMTEPQNTAIVKSIIAMGHQLNLTVSAEGVETDMQLALLKSLGCDEAQGYFLTKPLEGEQFGKWLAAAGRPELGEQELPPVPGQRPLPEPGSEG